MKQEIREEMIATLMLWTGWSLEAFENKTGKEITELYDRYVKG
ncbi:hypothetical protein ACXYMX_00375 [Sporosarcina sp. CAU 1771]